MVRLRSPQVFQGGFAPLILIIIVAAGIFGVMFFLKWPDPGERHGVNKRADDGFWTGSTKEKFEVFPARLEDFQTPPRMYGLWPYGIKGNDSMSHNEGHPGWDLELKKGSKLYAIADLKISQIHGGDHQIEGGEEIKVIEAGTRLKSGNFNVVYHSVINIEKDVVEGAIIKEGAPLAEVGFPLSDESAMIHFGIFAPNDSVGVCPTPYFSEELQKTIKKIVANSVDKKPGKPYSSACIGKINKDIYYQNFPDRVKYLRGGEVWE